MAIEDYLDDPDDIQEFREAIQSTLSNTFGRKPFVVHTKTTTPGFAGGSPVETVTDIVGLEGLFKDAVREIEEDIDVPIETESDALLILSTDYLEQEGQLDTFGGRTGQSEYDRLMEISFDGQRHRVLRIDRKAQFKNDALVLVAQLQRTPNGA